MIDGFFWNGENVLNNNVEMLSHFNEHSFGARKELNVNLIGVEGELDVASTLFERALFDMRTFEVPFFVTGNLGGELRKLTNKLYNESGYQELKFNADDRLTYLAKTVGAPKINKITDKHAECVVSLKALPRRSRIAQGRLHVTQGYCSTDPLNLVFNLPLTSMANEHKLKIPRDTVQIEITKTGSITNFKWNGLSRQFKDDKLVLTTRLNRETVITYDNSIDAALDFKYFVEVL